MLRVGEFVKQIANGDRQCISKAITLVESTLEQDQRYARQLMKQLPKPSKPCIRLGFTGSPGAGKSTLLESFGLWLLEKDKVAKMAVLAIDPSSDKSGGSILGDKTRMTRLSTLQRAFIRPSPARGSLGGITVSTARAAAVCEASGHDLICIETVGVGQSETAIAAVSDVTVLVVAPGAGDDLQGIKKGVTECADVVVVNKCDLAGADLTASFYKNAMHLQVGGRSKKVVSVSAKTGQGLGELWDVIKECMTTITPVMRQAKMVAFTRQQLRMEIEAQLCTYLEGVDVMARGDAALTAGFARKLLHHHRHRSDTNKQTRIRGGGRG